MPPRPQTLTALVPDPASSSAEARPLAAPRPIARRPETLAALEPQTGFAPQPAAVAVTPAVAAEEAVSAVWPEPHASPAERPRARVPRVRQHSIDMLLELDAPARPASRDLVFEDLPQPGAATESAETLQGFDAPAAHELETSDVALPDDVPEPELEPAVAEQQAATEDASEPEVEVAAEATSDAGAAETETETETEPLSAIASLPDGFGLPPGAQPELAVGFPAQDKAASADDQHRQRAKRAITRVLACRDCFRWLGGLGVPDEERKGVARMLVELDVAAGRQGVQPMIAKEPEAALREASAEQLDALERALSPIEDRLLALDDLVPPATFRHQLENRKQSKKIVARYGRVLASRKFPAGQRRDRFELIATHLLSARAGAGRRALPPERARSVLEFLLGGMPRKQKEGELSEALAYLRQMLERLLGLSAPDEFFEGGWFLDTHGYKVSMRDQLLSPEFVYLSVLIDVAIHNRLEGWIGERERLHDAKQFTAGGSPREQMMRRLQEQEEAVDDIFGVKRRPSPQTRSSEPPKAAPVLRSSKPPPAKRKQNGVTIDRSLTLMVGSLLVILISGGVLAFEFGLVGVEEHQALDAKDLAELSPMLARGWIRGSEGHRRLDGMIQRVRWMELDPRSRTEQANQLAKTLSGRGVKDAHLVDVTGPVMEIRGGLVEYVKGGKL